MTRSSRSLVPAVVVALVVAAAARGGASIATATTDRYAVGVRVETFTDRSRPTPPNGTYDGAPSRTLRTVIYYPARGAAADDVTRGARPADGRFPIVLFSHGSAATPESYGGLLRKWAAAGYVVIAPEYPLSSEHAPGGWTQADRGEQPADASFVLDRALRRRWLEPVVDADHIAASGHSLGAHTTFALAYGRCCRDPRISAAISLAGVGYAEGGLIEDPDPPPLLLVHDARDRAVPAAESARVFDEAPGPRALVTVHESLGDLAHQLPYNGGGRRAATITTAATLDFLAFALRGEPRALARLCRHASVPPAAEARTAGLGPEEDRPRGDAPC